MEPIPSKQVLKHLSIEARHQTKLQFFRLYEKYGNVAKCARDLGIASSTATVWVRKYKANGKNFIQANYVVYNTVSLKSASYHLISESQNSKIWRQEFRWSELFKCRVESPEAEECETMENTFPYNLYDGNIPCPSNPFLCLPYM